MEELTKKKCVPCEGGVPPATKEQAEEFLKKLDGWDMIDESDIPKIKRDFKFKNFKEAMEFVNKVADLAEEEQHHPDILIHGWNNVKITFYTHSIKGLHENDFIMAAKVNEIMNK